MDSLLQLVHLLTVYCIWYTVHCYIGTLFIDGQTVAVGTLICNLLHLGTLKTATLIAFGTLSNGTSFIDG